MPVLLGATIGYWGVALQPELIGLGLLTFAAGVLTPLTVEELIPKDHETLEEGWERPVPHASVNGFALVALTYAYLQ